MSTDEHFARTEGSSTRLNLVAIAILLAVALLAGSGALRGWWRDDDPQVLLQAYLSSPLGVLFRPAVWKTLSASNFTPLVTISFDADLAVAGLRPRFFYFHQLLAVFLAAVLLERLLRRFVRPMLSIAGAAIFLVAPQTVLAVRMLMVRHYIEGLALSLGALILWDRAIVEDSPRLRRMFAGAAAVLYLIAMLAKEVYAPLPLLFIAIALIRGVSLRRGFALIAPAIVAAIVYVPWRLAMLGSVGGYDSAQAHLFPVAPLAHGMFGGGWRMTAALMVITVVFVPAIFLRFRSALILGLASLLFVAIPLAPVLSAFQPRYGFVPTTTVIALAAIAAESGFRRGAQWFMILLALPLIAAGQTERFAYEKYAQAMQAEGKYIWNGSGPMLFARSSSWYLQGIADLRKLEKKSEAPPFVCSMYGLALENAPGPVMSVAGSEMLVPVDIPRLDEAARMRGRLDNALPISVEAASRDDNFEWKFTPDGGRWLFLGYPSYWGLEIPSRGSRRVPEGWRREYFRVVREMPDGRWNVTSPLDEHPDGGRVEWRNF
jgi:hypothetical protein